MTFSLDRRPHSAASASGFSSDTTKPAPNEAGPFLGIKVGGPTRVGHYFLPTFTVPGQNRVLPNQGPILRPARLYNWSLIYDPAAKSGLGQIIATLGDETTTLPLKPGQRANANGAILDYFGLFWRSNRETLSRRP